jgi:NodT family efflux transporter outer membrane factor (OMF) lipoprotein
MKRLSNIFIAIAVGLMLTGCGIYDKYESKATVPADAFGKDAGNVGGTSLAQTSWRQFFTDPLLQELIDKVLANNTDLNSTRIAIEKSEASLKAARMAYLPSLSFTPSGTINRFNGLTTKTYSLPLQISLDLDAFGSITSQKRKSEVVLQQAKIYEESVRANLISTVAQQYFMLQVLDLQMKILTATDSLWKKSLDTQKALWENGKAYSTAINQMESSYLNVKTQMIDNRRNIRSVENAICRLLAVTPQHIRRSEWRSSSLPTNIGTGVPATMLQYRPDIRISDLAMAEAFYNTQSARAAFFPSITLSGSAGWTNNNGIIVDPGKFLWNALGSLTQPIFARGSIKANYKIQKLTEEDLQKKYVQTVINAGNEVNEALADCQASRDKHQYYHRQVEVLHDAYIGTHELMDNGKANYLEVLTAQESLLSAQLNEVSNMYNGAQAVIALYIALGGGIK